MEFLLASSISRKHMESLGNLKVLSTSSQKRQKDQKIMRIDIRIENLKATCSKQEAILKIINVMKKQM